MRFFVPKWISFIWEAKIFRASHGSLFKDATEAIVYIIMQRTGTIWFQPNQNFQYHFCENYTRFLLWKKKGARIFPNDQFLNWTYLLKHFNLTFCETIKTFSGLNCLCVQISSCFDTSFVLPTSKKIFGKFHENFYGSKIGFFPNFFLNITFRNILERPCQILDRAF